jgi:hypothetical protein
MWRFRYPAYQPCTMVSAGYRWAKAAPSNRRSVIGFAGRGASTMPATQLLTVERDPRDPRKGLPRCRRTGPDHGLARPDPRRRPALGFRCRTGDLDRRAVQPGRAGAGGSEQCGGGFMRARSPMRRRPACRRVQPERARGAIRAGQRHCDFLCRCGLNGDTGRGLGSHGAPRTAIRALRPPHEKCWWRHPCSGATTALD